MKNSLLIATLFTFVFSNWAAADLILWNTWGTPDSGTIITSSGQVDVSFASANSHANVDAYPSWLPSATYADGVAVDNGPTGSNGIMQLTGGNENVNTVTFSTPVVDPVMSIWSLGSTLLQASFDFTDTPVYLSGGPNAEYGGQGLNVVGNSVFGVEGNGTIQFSGTYSSITWLNPIFENWYGFNVGVTATVPEPTSIFPILVAGFWMMGNRKRKME